MRQLSILFSLIAFIGLAALAALPWAVTWLPPNQIQAQPDETAGTERFLTGAFTLAVSWQPAFCETAPQKPECRSQTADRFDASHLALHGLWPDPVGNTYCAVNPATQSFDEQSAWHNLPEPEITPELLQRLAIAMPGVASNLHRHEWIKHGTCAGADAATYFAASLALTNALNTGPVQQLFSGNIGTQISAADIRSAFDAAFGNGAGARVQIECETDGARRLISELRISLFGHIGTAPDLGTLMRAAPNRSRGCPGGTVDPVGTQ